MLRTEDAVKDRELVERARQHLGECLRLRIDAYGEQDSRTAEAYYYYGSTFNREDLDKADEYLSTALGIFRAVDPDNANVPFLLLDLGGGKETQNDLDAAERFVTEGWNILRAKNGERHLTVCFPMIILSRIAEKRGDLNRAQTLLDQAKDIARPQDRATTFKILQNQQHLATLRGDRAAAAAAAAELAAMQRQDPSLQ
jgi:tetratricopeptide (TPR) repeat protein